MKRSIRQPTPLLICRGRIIDPSQGIDALGDLFIAEGRIRWLGNPDGSSIEGCQVLHAEGMIVSPGFIDLHCHLRQPGFEGKEIIATGTRAAARGGFTTVCCMPNTDPPIDSRATVEYVQRIAQGEGVVRVLPIGCITRGRKGEELVELAELAEAGVVAFSDDGRPVTKSGLMRQALEHSLAVGLPVSEHCEDLALTGGGVMNEGRLSASLGLKGMPAAAEEIMVARDIALAELTGARLHIAHVSTAGSVELIRRAREKGTRLTAEVTPHHLTLTEDRVVGNAQGAFYYDTNAKVKPPLRTAKDIEALVYGLKEGVIDAIATDHAPHAAIDKQCEFDSAAFGISGLETALGSVMSLVDAGKFDLMTLISKLTAEPARIFGIHAAGTLKAGMPGDVTIFDPVVEWVVDPDSFASKGRNTPLGGSLLRGKVMATVVGGEIVYQDDSVKLEMATEERVGR